MPSLADGPRIGDDRLPITMSYSSSSASVPGNHIPATARVGTCGAIDDTTFDWLKTRPSSAAVLLDGRFASENDVATYVRLFLLDIIKGLGLELDVVSELQVFSVRPDMWVISREQGTPLAAVEVKKPSSKGGINIFNNELILGELFDQMKQIQNFYGCQFSVGFLTDGNNWRVCWYGDDKAMLEQMPKVENAPNPLMTAPTTPQKVRVALCCHLSLLMRAAVRVLTEPQSQQGGAAAASTRRTSPIGSTPSKRNPKVYAVNQDGDGDIGGGGDAAAHVVPEREVGDRQM
jgi:hypothetical protein